MLYSIVVTTDFSPLSRQAFPYARKLAEKVHARLNLVHVARGPEAVTAWQRLEETEDEVRARLAWAEARLRELIAADEHLRGFQVMPRVLHGEPAEAMERFQKQEGIDLIVVASHGSTGTEGFPFGSFAGRLIQLAACPVLVLPVLPPATAQATATFPPRRLLAPHDFSRSSQAGLEIARAWAAAFEVKVKLLHVVEPVPSPEGYLLGTTETVAEYFEKIRLEAQHRLDEIARRDWQGIAVDAEVRTGKPAAEILRAAIEGQADLIVIASRGLTPVARLALGSVAERTIHGARCPTLVVHAKEPLSLT